MSADFSTVPIIDVTELITDREGQLRVAHQIDAACRQSGFFYVVNHGIHPALMQQLEALSREFFALSNSAKQQIAMSKGGRAWRGHFQVGAELTSGKPDQKEGLYFGTELAVDHPLVQAGTPLHGPNQFPDSPSELREIVLKYMSEVTKLGHALMKGIAMGLGLKPNYFEEHGVSDPLILFRIFNYPPTPPSELWGVGEHTDYGLLTILFQDDVGGLEVKSGSNWVSAPPIPGSFICNIGDMLDRMTRGVYRSTPHRVRNLTQRHRLSFPLFFDPNFFAEVGPIELPDGSSAVDDRDTRWDRSSVHEFRGTYGDYLLSKVGKVFPELKSQVLSKS